jgi:hypothetical protein
MCSSYKKGSSRLVKGDYLEIERVRWKMSYWKGKSVVTWYFVSSGAILKISMNPKLVAAKAMFFLSCDSLIVWYYPNTMHKNQPHRTVCTKFRTLMLTYYSEWSLKSVQDFNDRCFASYLRSRTYLKMRAYFGQLQCQKTSVLLSGICRLLRLWSNWSNNARDVGLLADLWSQLSAWRGPIAVCAQ